MADESNTQSHQTGEAVEKADHAEVTDRGFYNHLVGKKEKGVEDERNTQSHQTGEPVEKPDQVEVTNGGFYNHLVGKKEKEVEDERNTQSHQTGEAVEKADHVEVTDRGFFNHLVGKKEKEVEDKRQEEDLATGMEKVSVEEPEEKKEEHDDGEKHESLFTKLQRSSSSSSSSSDEEEEVIDDNGEVIKRKKKKGLKEKIQENLPGHKDSEGEHVTALPAPAPAASVQTHGGHHDTDVAVEKIDGDAKIEAPPAVPEEEKKGFLEKIKEKLPGGHKKPEDAAAVPVTHAAPAPVHAPAAEEVSSPDGEKKGLLGKIMDKLPGYNKAAGEEDKAAAAAGEHKTSS